jgi:hypothetical protein
MPTFSQDWDLFPLFGAPFLLIGIGGLSSPLWLRHKASHMVYLPTNQRALSRAGFKSYTIHTYLPKQLESMTRKEHPDGLAI